MRRLAAPMSSLRDFAMTKKQPSKEYLDQLCLSVGKAIVTFAHLEHEITMTIADIFGLTEIQERGLVRPMSIANKTGLLRLLAKQAIKPNERKRVIDALKEIDDAADERNGLAHGFYGHKKGEIAITSFSGAARLTGNPVRWTPRKLELFVVTLRHLRGEVAHFRPLFPMSLQSPKTHHSKLASEQR